MSLLHSLYLYFVPGVSNKLKLLAVDLVLLFGTMALTIIVRLEVYSSLQAGADVVTGFLVGFTVVVAFNSIVYIGSLAEPDS